MHGFCNMIPTVAIIFFVFVMQEGMSDIGIADYIIHSVKPLINAQLLPVITFLLVALLNFSTGSAWGIPAIVSPIIIPLAFSIGANPLLIMGAIVSGRYAGEPRLLLFGCNGPNIQLLQNEQYGSCAFTASLCNVPQDSRWQVIYCAVS